MSAPEHVASVTQLPVRALGTTPPVPSPAVADVPREPIITLDAVKDAIQPPDIWSDRRPSLREIWLYGVYGRWTRAKGPVRIAGAVYATVIALPIHALAYIFCWLAERPARFFVVATVAALTMLAL